MSEMKQWSDMGLYHAFTEVMKRSERSGKGGSRRSLMSVFLQA